MLNYFIDEWESDCLILEGYLSELEYYSGSERTTGQFKSVKRSTGSGSMLYGVTWKGFLKYNKDGTKIFREKCPKTGLFYTKCRSLYPDLADIFKEFSFLYFPEFEWSQVQLNKNYRCPPHYDSSNIGESILLTLGDFKGGETVVKINDEEIIHDSHNKLIKFNGSKYLHWTTEFEGNRFALVFFTNNKLLKNIV